MGAEGRERRAEGRHWRALRAWLAALTAALGLLVAPSEALAELPEAVARAGFSTQKIGAVTLHFPPGERGPAERLAEETPGVEQKLRQLLGADVLTAPVSVVLARDAEDLLRLSPPGSPPPEYAQGVAYPSERLVLLSQAPVASPDLPALPEVYRHELAHIALHDAAGAEQVPRWFDEGFAVFASGEGVFSRVEPLWLATVGGTLIPLGELDRAFTADSAQLAYAESADLVRFLEQRGDRHRFGQLLDALGKGRSFEKALFLSQGLDLEALETEWRTDAETRFTLWPILLGSGTFWVLSVGLFGLAYAKRRRDAKKVLDRWGREEAAHDARRRALEQKRAALAAEREGQRQLSNLRERLARLTALARRLAGPRVRGAHIPLTSPLGASPAASEGGRSAAPLGGPARPSTAPGAGTRR